jgi:hypothetical protein
MIITKFKIFEDVQNEFDPYGEEDWEDSMTLSKGDEVLITDRLLDYKDLLPNWFMNFIGKKTFIYDDQIYYNQGVAGIVVDAKFYVDDESKVKAYFIPTNCLKKIKKIDESFIDEIDPYGEEDWEDKNLKKGDLVKILPKFQWYLDNTRNHWDRELHMKFIGKIAEIVKPYYGHWGGTNCCLISNKIHKLKNYDDPWEENWHAGYLIPIDCVALVGVDEPGL